MTKASLMQASAQHFLDGGGAAAVAIRSMDWAATPLGVLSGWPSALRTAVSMVLSSRFPQCIFWGPELIGIYNDAYRPILGSKPEAMGQPMRVVWPEVWLDIGPIAAKALRGEATFIEDYALVVDRSGGPEQTYFTFCYSPIRDETGAIVGLLDTVIETTAKVQAVNSARILNAELAHRIQNTLATVAAIANQTYRSAESKDEMHALLSERILALSRAHALLTRSSGDGAAIKAVVEEALSPLHGNDGRVAIEGPPIKLTPKQSLSLALAVHELGTNAIKYGALSASAGRITVRWQVDAHASPEELELEWIERGGPSVKQPTKVGFGSRLIKYALAEDFGGKTTISYEPEGVRCVLKTEMSKVGGRSGSRMADGG